MTELMRWLLYLPRPASTFARGLDYLHATIIFITLAGATGVTALTIWFVVHHHEARGGRRGRRRGISSKTEYGIIGGLLAFFVAVWVIGYRQYVVMATPPDETFDVYVIGKQWMWAFAYADGAVSNRDLYVPVGKPVRLLLTSRDVIHSFFVPEMRIKQDAVPGRMTVAWFQATEPGTYEVLCAEYCGLSHSRMRGHVIALPVADYAAWRRAQWDPSNRANNPPLAGSLPEEVLGEPAESLVTMGRTVAAERGCLRCHTLDGTPHLGPSWAGLYMSEVLLEDGKRVRADATYLTRSMMDPTVEVHAGYAPIMPSYMGLLDAPEVAALVELIRSLEERTATDLPATPLPAQTDRAPPLPMMPDPREPAPTSPDVSNPMESP